MPYTDPLVLQNGSLRAVVLAGEGGRVASLQDASSGFEFLMQSKHPHKHLPPSMDARFRDGACAGIEECLPSVSGSGDETAGGPVPDHGDFWQLPWSVEHRLEDELEIQALGFSRKFLFQKRLSLHANTLRLDYTLTNRGAEKSTFLYACHPLLAVEAGDRIVLADEVKSLRVGSSVHGRLGVPGDQVDWPLHHPGSGIDLSRALPDDSGTGDMLYTGHLTQGWCGLYRAAAQQGIVVRFNPAQLPYAGLWLCYGGWPPNGIPPLQYTVAFEPTVAPCGMLSEAQAKHSAPEIEAGESRNWTIDFEISGSRLTYEEFRRACTG